MVELILLTMPACPIAAAFEERLAVALAGYPPVVVRGREVADEREAAEAGMHGSPTLLIDGVDPFAQPGQVTSVSCRFYRDAAGHLAGAPPVEALRKALAAAGYDGPPPPHQPPRHGRARQRRAHAVSRAGTKPASNG